MVERQDIDALLVSALYGELTPAEETRLATHLDSHPADRAVLADLTHARELVRESRLLQIQLDPPQSVSALLMQEAARRAPKPAAEGGWFARFVGSFMAHPAMAAAAMLVIVVGAATLVTRTKGDHFADSTAPSSAPSTATAALDERDQSNVASEGGETADGASGGRRAGSAAAAAPEAHAGQGSAAAAADSFRVALDDQLDPATVRPTENDNKQAAMKVGAKADAAKGGAGEAQDKAQLEIGTAKKNSAPPSVGAVAPSRPAGSAGPAGIELRTQQYAPKDFDDAPASRAPAKLAKEAAKSEELSADFGAAGGNAEVARGDVAGTGAGGYATPPGSPRGGVTTGTSVRSVPQAEPIPTNATPSPPPPPPPAATKAPAKREPVAVAKPEPAKPAAPTTKTVDRSRAAAPAEEKVADPELTWAREQHVALINEVRAGECRKAASIATGLSNRAPAYYRQNVETDRSVKDCIVYINNERERDAEQRAERVRAAQKRSNERSKATTSKAAPPADAKPAKPATTDAK